MGGSIVSSTAPAWGLCGMLDILHKQQGTWEPVSDECGCSCMMAKNWFVFTEGLNRFGLCKRGGVQVSRPKGREDTESGGVAPGTQSVVKCEVLVWLILLPRSREPLFLSGTSVPYSLLPVGGQSICGS